MTNACTACLAFETAIASLAPRLAMQRLFRTKHKTEDVPGAAEQVSRAQLDEHLQLEIWLAHLRQRFGDHGAALVKKLQRQPIKDWTPEFVLVVVKVLEGMITNHDCRSFPCGGLDGHDLVSSGW